jgi:hypothetical protein
MVDLQESQWTDTKSVLHGQHTEQVLFADFTVEIGAVEGGVVNIAAPNCQAANQIHLRREPPYVLPRRELGFLDRNREQELVGQALARAQVVDIHAPDGTGKTALTSRAMQAQLPSAFPGGIVYLSARHETREDLLQDLFGTFFETDKRVKVNENDVRRHMAGTQALIAVDDANLLEEGDVRDLAQVVPQCALLIAARKQQVWQGTGISLRGLPGVHAVRLFEQHWGPVEEQDQPTVEAICEAVGNIPLNIIKTATIAARQKLSLDQVLEQVQPKDGQREPKAQALGLIAGQLSAEERLVLGGLAAPGGLTIGVRALPVITGLPMKEVSRHLALLQAQGLVYVNSLRCSLDDGLRPYIERAWTSEEMRARAAAYYLGKAPTLQRLPRDPDEENVLCALDYFFQRGGWQQVVTIARSIDRYLACTGRWGQWRKRLDQAMQAARELGDRATEAWAQNQLGIIAMGAGETSTAKQLFRSALSIRRALGDRPGAVVTRWNLRLITVPPPTPWDRLLNKILSILQSGSLWLPIALAAVVSLAIVALLSAPDAIAGTGPSPTLASVPLVTTLAPSSTPLKPTITATPVQPTVTSMPAAEVSPSVEVWLTDDPPVEIQQADPPPPAPAISVWLPEGCGHTYEAGAYTEVYFQANVAGQVDVYLSDRGGGGTQFLFSGTVQAGQAAGRGWTMPEPGGNWSLVAVLNGGQAREYCGFTVESPTPTPVMVDVELVDGCDRMYEPGSVTGIRVVANESGRVTLSLYNPSGSLQDIWSADVTAGQPGTWRWHVPREAGDWELAAVLGDEHASDLCHFTVQDAAPTPEVDITLVDGCGQEFESGTATQIRLWASVGGSVDVFLSGPEDFRGHLFTEYVEANQDVYIPWTVSVGPEGWVLEAYLNNSQAEDYCSFRVKPIQTPEVWIETDRGCGEVTYDQGAEIVISFGASVNGYLTVWLSGRKTPLFSDEVVGGEAYGVVLETDMAPGWQQVSAGLAKEEANAVCDFYVREMATVTPVEIAPVPPKGTLPPELAPTGMPEATATPPLARPTHTPLPTATANPG